MSLLKCKMCGGDLEISEGMTVCECEYCGAKQTVPSADDEKKMTLFNRANRLRFNCEFDKASGVYESIVTDFPEEAEAYWGLVLCKYGIEYVDDPATAKKIPTCHRSSFESVMDDNNFEQVMENADTVARGVYREEAKQIEELRKGIIEVSSKEEPYDIFICYKETDENGDRTIDSVIAQDVYDALTEKGYKVFFSRITLEDKLGQEYEPYIFAALNSAKVMLAFGTNYEYYNAVWVKNEWSRFLQLISKGEKKTLIPCYKNIDAYDMPKEFAKLQAQDMGKVGAIQDLLRGIEKILPTNGGKSEGTVNDTVVASPQSATTESLLKRAFMFLEDKDWQQADEYCNKVLDIDPENAQAYLGKLMAELKVKKQVDLKNCTEPFDNLNNYKKIIRFGDEKLKEELREYIDNCKLNAKKEYKKRIDNIAKVIANYNNSIINNTTNKLIAEKTSLVSNRSKLGIFKTKEKQNIDERITSIDEVINKRKGDILELDLLEDDSTSFSNVPISFEDALKELLHDESLKKDVLAAYPKIQFLSIKGSDYVKFVKYSRAKDYLEDPILVEAIDMVIETGNTSIIHQMAPGATALMMINKMELLGVVGPVNGTNPREVLIKKEQLRYVNL